MTTYEVTVTSRLTGADIGTVLYKEKAPGQWAYTVREDDKRREGTVRLTKPTMEHARSVVKHLI